MPEQPPCEERVKLERGVIDAVQAVYGAKGSDRIPARILERDAVRALDERACVRARSERHQPLRQQKLNELPLEFSIEDPVSLVPSSAAPPGRLLLH